MFHYQDFFSFYFVCSQGYSYGFNYHFHVNSSHIISSSALCPSPRQIYLTDLPVFPKLIYSVSTPSNSLQCFYPREAQLFSHCSSQKAKHYFLISPSISFLITDEVPRQLIPHLNLFLVQSLLSITSTATLDEVIILLELLHNLISSHVYVFIF